MALVDAADSRVRTLARLASADGDKRCQLDYGVVARVAERCVATQRRVHAGDVGRCRRTCLCGADTSNSSSSSSNSSSNNNNNNSTSRALERRRSRSRTLTRRAPKNSSVRGCRRRTRVRCLAWRLWTRRASFRTRSTGALRAGTQRGGAWLWCISTLGGFCAALDCSPANGARLVAAVGDGALRVWDIGAAQCAVARAERVALVARVATPATPVSALRLLARPGGERMRVSVHWRGLERATLTALALHPACRGIAALGDVNGRVRVYDIDANRVVCAFSAAHSNKQRVQQLSWRRTASCAPGGAADGRDASAGDELNDTDDWSGDGDSSALSKGESGNRNSNSDGGNANQSVFGPYSLFSLSQKMVLEHRLEMRKAKPVNLMSTIGRRHGLTAKSLEWSNYGALLAVGFTNGVLDVVARRRRLDERVDAHSVC